MDKVGSVFSMAPRDRSMPRNNFPVPDKNEFDSYDLEHAFDEDDFFRKYRWFFRRLAQASKVILALTILFGICCGFLDFFDAPTPALQVMEGIALITFSLLFLMGFIGLVAFTLFSAIERKWMEVSFMLFLALCLTWLPIVIRFYDAIFGG
jgi:hypothetical protein